MSDELVEKLSVPPGVDDEEAEEFFEGVIDTVREHLHDNRETYLAQSDNSGAPLINGHVLNPDNINQIQVRARPLEVPRLTFWLKDCPIWANDAWTETVWPFGVNAYNGKVTVLFDIRPT